MTAFASQIIFKNEESNLDPKYSNAIERKCGEVILLANTKFWFACTFCNERFHSIVIFQDHIKVEHVLTDAEDDSNGEDPLDLPRNKQEHVFKLDTNNSTGDNINEVHEDDMSNSCFISTQKFNEPEYCSDFMSDQSDNEIGENNTSSEVNEVTNRNINELGYDNYNQTEEKSNGSLFCKDIEDLLSVPNKIKKKRNRKKKVHSCSLCQHTARNKNSLEAHMLSHHDTGTRHQCEECGKCFRSASNLKSHLVIHSGTRPYKCDFCDSGFSHPNSLKTHRYIHTGERPHKCNQCEKGFVSSSGLKIHKREHTGETPYVCQFCERGFANKCHYNRHIISHSSRRAFECKICNKAFKHRETFNKHMVCHTNDRKLACDVCQKRFIHKKNLVQHKKIHLAIKQYTCKICHKEFAQNAGLYSHMKYHKNKE